MCINRVENLSRSPLCPSKRRPVTKKSKLQIIGLTFRKRSCEQEMEEKDMELQNLKLYLENQTIVEENEKLRKRASLLHQENLALSTELRKKFPQLDHLSITALFLLHKH